MPNGRTRTELNLSALPCDVQPGQSSTDSLHLALDFSPEKTPATSRRGTVKATRLNVQTLNQLLETHLDIMNLPFWRKVNRIIFQAASICEDGELDLYPKSSSNVLNSPTTYLAILNKLRERFGIQIYVGMPLVYASDIDHSVHRQIQEHPETFWKRLASLIHKYGFDGAELNLEGIEYLQSTFANDLQKFQYRHKLMLIFKNNVGFIDHHGRLMKAISEQVECLVINAYGYFKFHHISNTVSKMLPKCECNVEDWLTSYIAYSDYDISARKLMMAIDTSAVLYFLNANDFSEVDCISFTPSRVVEQLKVNGEQVGEESFGYTEYLDREKHGCVLECRQRGVVISYDNLRMKTMKLKLCRDKMLKGCVLGNLIDDVEHFHENNTINLMDKYI